MNGQKEAYVPEKNVLHNSQRLCTPQVVYGTRTNSICNSNWMLDANDCSQRTKTDARTSTEIMKRGGVNDGARSRLKCHPQ